MSPNLPQNHDHPDFQQAPWISLLKDSSIEWTHEVPAQSNDTVTNSMFTYTLQSERGILASLSFHRPSSEPTAILQKENCMLLSLGDGLDGKAGRCHGGFNSLVLDQVTGSCAHHARPAILPPATATMTVDYRAPIGTPCVVLARAWVISIEGRKTWLKGLIEDGTGTVYAECKALFVSPRVGGVQGVEVEAKL